MAAETSANKELVCTDVTSRPAYIHTFPFLRLTCHLPPPVAVHPPEITDWERKRCKELSGETKNPIFLIFVLVKEGLFVAWLPACRMSEVDQA